MLFHRHCAQPGCIAAAGRTRCQDCGGPFCAAHVAAVEFRGFRAGSRHATAWTRYVCATCAQRATHTLTAAVSWRADE